MCPSLTAEAELSWISLQTDLSWPYRLLIGIDGALICFGWCHHPVLHPLQERTAVQGSSEPVLPLQLCALLSCWQLCSWGSGQWRRSGKSAHRTFHFHNKLSCENVCFVQIPWVLPTAPRAPAPCQVFSQVTGELPGSAQLPVAAQCDLGCSGSPAGTGQ